MNQIELQKILCDCGSDAFKEAVEDKENSVLFTKNPVMGLAITILISKIQSSTIEKIYEKLKDGYLND